MLIDTRNENKENKEGFSPNVQNQQIKTKNSAWMWFLIVILCIIPIPFLFIFVIISKRNWFNRQQNKINEAASNISVQLAQRRDTLIKLVDSTKSYMKYEKDLLDSVTKLRSTWYNIDKNNFTKLSKTFDKISNGIKATFEAYPDLKANQSIIVLMSAADLNEREIAASRRLYNHSVSIFNQKLYVFPDQAIAASMKLYNMPLFEASDQQKQDVSLDLTKSI